MTESAPIQIRAGRRPRLVGVSMAALLLVATLVSGPAQSSGQALASGWQAGPGATDANTYAGVIDSPQDEATVPSSGLLSVSGWFVDVTAEGWSGADDIQVFLGSMETGLMLARGTVGLSRPDVGSALGNPYWAASGWAAEFDASRLPVGQAALS